MVSEKTVEKYTSALRADLSESLRREKEVTKAHADLKAEFSALEDELHQIKLQIVDVPEDENGLVYYKERFYYLMDFITKKLPLLTEELEESRQQYQEMQRSLMQRAVNIAESANNVLARSALEHANELAAVRADLEAQLAASNESAVDELTNVILEHDEKVAALTQQHSDDITALREEHARALNEKTQGYLADIAESEQKIQRMAAEIKALKTKNTRLLKTAKRQVAMARAKYPGADDQTRTLAETTQRYEDQLAAVRQACEVRLVEAAETHRADIAALRAARKEVRRRPVAVVRTQPTYPRDTATGKTFLPPQRWQLEVLRARGPSRHK